MSKKSLLAAVLGAVLLASAPVTGALAQQQPMVCLDPNAARAATQQGGLLSLAAVQIRAGITGQVVSYQLCQWNGRYVYQINALEGGGYVNRYVVDAVSGAILPVQ